MVYFRPVFFTYTIIRTTLHPFSMEINKSHAGHVERMGENRNAYRILVGKPPKESDSFGEIELGGRKSIKIDN